MFTRHAKEKFALLSRFRFRVSQDEVTSAVRNPDKVERRGEQTFSMKVINEEYALRVVHENRKGIIVVITYDPVRRKRYGV